MHAERRAAPSASRGGACGIAGNPLRAKPEEMHEPGRRDGGHARRTYVSLRVELRLSSAGRRGRRGVAEPCVTASLIPSAVRGS